MTLPADIIAAVQSSPVYAETTARYNEYARECNRTGHLISPAERANLQTIRILLVLKDDPDVRTLYAGYMWEQLNAEKETATP